MGILPLRIMFSGLAALWLGAAGLASAAVVATGGAARPYLPVAPQMGAALTGAFQSAFAANPPLPRTDPILSAVTQMDLSVPGNLTALEPFHAQLAALEVDENMLASARPDELRTLFSMAADEAEADVVERAYRAVGAVTPGLSAAMDKDAFAAFEEASDELARIERENAVFLSRFSEKDNSALKMVRLYGRLARERIESIRRGRVAEKMEATKAGLGAQGISVAVANGLDYDGDWDELNSKIAMAKDYFASNRAQAHPNTIKPLTGPLKGFWEFKLDGSNDRLFFRYLSDTRQIVLLRHVSRGNVKPAQTRSMLNSFLTDDSTKLNIAPELPDELKPMQQIKPADLKIRLNPRQLQPN